MIGLITVASQLLLNGLTHTYGQPHYYNATWTGAALLLGVAITRLSGWRPWAGRVAAGTLALATASVSLLVAVRLHSTGGTRQSPNDPFTGNYGPTIANQQQIAVAIGSVPIRQVRMNVRIFPVSIETLRLLQPGGADAPTDRLVLAYLHPEDGDDGRLVLLMRVSPPAAPGPSPTAAHR